MEQVSQLVSFRKKRLGAAEVSAKTAIYIALVVLGILFVFPLVWMICTSTKTDYMLAKQAGSIKLFLVNFSEPKTFLSNFKTVLASSSIPLYKYAVNSLLYAAAVVVGNIVVNALAGYVLAKLDFPGKKFLSFMVLFLIVVPIETTIIPLYSIALNLQIVGTVFAVILPPMISIFNIFLFRQFFEGVPKEYEEAARIDGANRLRIFFSVIMPLSKPILATVATFAFIGSWNDYIWPTMVLPAVQGNEWPLRPIQAAIDEIQSNPAFST
ncbi:MAG: carbohydrate ABC transporter permease, partial [Clostridiales bacterium]|nr:carbohydrate ABC transporter permease [Clostridiales bacterium]